MSRLIKCDFFFLILCGSLLFFAKITAQEYPIKKLEGFEKVAISPLVYICPHFLSDEECDHLIEIARSSLKRTEVIDPHSPHSKTSTGRTSLGTFLPFITKDQVVINIRARIAKITEIPLERAERMQILYYDIGGEFVPHYDYFDLATIGGLVNYNRGGQRIATFIVYLNTPEKGGETFFLEADLKIVPEKGKALLFYNLREEGWTDPMSLHAGLPVLEGEKWLMTQWLREKSLLKSRLPGPLQREKRARRSKALKFCCYSFVENRLFSK